MRGLAHGVPALWWPLPLSTVGMPHLEGWAPPRGCSPCCPGRQEGLSLEGRKGQAASAARARAHKVTFPWGSTHWWLFLPHPEGGFRYLMEVPLTLEVLLLLLRRLDRRKLTQK